MAVANLNEKLLFYTLQKSMLTNKLSNVQMTLLSASRAQIAASAAFNNRLSELYHDPIIGFNADPDTYNQYYIQLQSEHELELSRLNAWESQLDAEKDSYEAQLSEIQSYEKSWEGLLKKNIQSDFTYGGAGGK